MIVSIRAIKGAGRQSVCPSRDIVPRSKLRRIKRLKGIPGIRSSLSVILALLWPAASVWAHGLADQASTDREQIVTGSTVAVRSDSAGEGTAGGRLALAAVSEIGRGREGRSWRPRGLERGQADIASSEGAAGGRSEAADVGSNEGIRVTIHDGGPNLPPLVIVGVEGSYLPGDDEVLRKRLLALDLPVGMVLLSGVGGDLRTGIAIGRLIWANEFQTAVIDGPCVSACALAFLGGRPQRFAGSEAELGFRAIGIRGNERQADAAEIALVGGYLRDLGFTRAAIRFIVDQPWGAKYRLASDRARKIGIHVEEWTRDR
ncbi:MAG: hypothetical protein GY798_28920 [Hyphomicrobiales bacterium]|nr:hypothetical protein [Hyphomicrobiales bacterium]